MGKLLAIIIFVTLLKLATAGCAAPKIAAETSIETAQALCKSQGEGSYTFAMYTSLTAFGLPTPVSTIAGCEFQIMDNSCNILGSYAMPACGLPYTIEDSFLDYVLTITSIEAAADSSAYFDFEYANGAYSIGNNGCTCSSMSDTFPAVNWGCKCAFPVAGEPTKREISFAA